MSSNALGPGAVLGDDILVEKQLGAGGPSSIFLGRQLSTGLRCAIKAGSTEDALLVRESRILVRVPSNHVPRTLRIGHSAADGIEWFATELIDGVALGSLREEVRLPVQAVVKIILDVCDGLDAAHKRGIIHCDVKPSNIVVVGPVENPSSAYLLDFGIAKWLADPEDPFGGIVGTPHFMAPEQLQDRELVVAATDVWALGLVAFYLLTGRDYFLEGSMYGLHREILTAPLVPASERAAHYGQASRIPSWFDDWFARCVCRDVRGRFARAGEASQALRQYQAWCRWSIALPDLGDFPLGSALSQVRALSQDPLLRLIRVERGSVIMVLEGSRDGFENVHSLFRSGALSHVAGVPIVSVDWRDAAGTSSDVRPVDVFISYAPRDISYCDELLIHLAMMRRQGMINEWYDRKLEPGAISDEQIREWLSTCDLTMALLSADYIASDRCFQWEMQLAIARHRAGDGRMVPVVLRACDWSHPPFSELQPLPRNGIPVSRWSDRDDAWATIIQDIRTIVNELRARRATQGR